MVTHLKTHNDLDGVGCKIALTVAVGPLASFEYHTYATIDDAIVDFVRQRQYSPGDTLVLADICPTQSVCHLLDSDPPEGLTVRLYDHHKTRNWVGKYSWATINQEKCGTELVFDAYCSQIQESTRELYRELCETIGAWDLWKKNSPLRKRGENLNTLLGFVGKEEFSRMFSRDPFADSASLIREIVRYLNARRDRYVHQVLKDQLQKAAYHRDGFGNTFKILFTTDYLSEIGEAALAYPDSEDVHYVCLINPDTNTCSLRARTGEIDVSTVAKAVNGGGHQAAAGFQVAFTEQIEEQVAGLLRDIES